MKTNESSKSRINEFLDFFRHIAHTCRIFPGESVAIEVLINPASGFFRNERTFHRVRDQVNKALAEADRHPRGFKEAVSVRFHETQSPLTLADQVLPVVRTLASDIGVDRRILVLAGGDGFHKDIGQVIMKADPKLFSKIILLRLPLGTGNDTSDVSDMGEACRLFLSPGAVKAESAISVQSSSGSLHYAFNVVSFGLDAFICQLTNHFKEHFRGDIYKVMVDVSTLFYDLFHKTDSLALTIRTKEGLINLKGRYLMNVFGRRGGITYGGRRPILPGAENFYLMDFFGLGRRLLYKPLIMAGRHKGLPEASFYEADEVILENYTRGLLAELDGEVMHLFPEHFPLTLKRLPDCLRVLAFPDNASSR